MTEKQTSVTNSKTHRKMFIKRWCLPNKSRAMNFALKRLELNKTYNA